MSSRRQSSAGHEDADEDAEDPGMALPQQTRDDLQVYATKAARKDSNGNEMRMDVLSSYFAAGLLQLDSGDTVVVHKKLAAEITKYNTAIRKEKKKRETEAEKEAEAKAKREAQEDFPSMADLEAEDNARFAKVSFVC